MINIRCFFKMIPSFYRKIITQIVHESEYRSIGVSEFKVAPLDANKQKNDRISLRSVSPLLRFSPAPSLCFSFFTISAIMLSFIFLPISSIAGNKNIGTQGALFLRIPVGARPAAMGAAYAGFGTDVYAIDYNPAGLGGIKNHQAAFQFQDRFGDIQQHYIAYAQPMFFNGKGVVAGSVNVLDLGKFDRTTETAGGFFNASTGTFSAQDLAVTLGYAYRVNRRLWVGGTGKFISQRIDRDRATGFATDGGVFYTPAWKWANDNLTLGFSLRNVGNEIRFRREGDPLPREYRAGLGYKMWDQRIQLAVDLVQPVGSEFRINVGGEFNPFKMVSLRVGYTTFTDVNRGLALGAGFNFKILSLDYAWTPQGLLGDNHRASLQIKF